jgi:hypothetical protein
MYTVHIPHHVNHRMCSSEFLHEDLAISLQRAAVADNDCAFVVNAERCPQQLLLSQIVV